MRHLAASALLAAAALPASAQLSDHVPTILDSGGPLSTEQASYDVRYYDLAVRVDPATQRIAGRLAATVDVVMPTDVLVLDLDTTFAVPRVEVGGQAAPVTRRGGQLWIGLGATTMPGTRLTATVWYEGAPRIAPRPPWSGGFTWAKTADGRPWIATSCQGEGADVWWPVKDHPSDEPDSVAISIAVPTGLTAASNGRLLSTESGQTLAGVVPGDAPSGDWTTFRWRTAYPVNTYNVALNIAPYRVIEDTYTSVTGETIPAVFYVLPERYEDGLRQWPQFKAHLRFYEETLGPYPWRRDKYGVAHTPHLGMEHQTINAYGSTFTDAPDGFDWLHHHELGHEWWGNLVTATDWRDWWLHEGFCAYMQPLYREKTQGRDVYLAAMRETAARLGNRQPVAPRTATTSDAGYISDVYGKGSVVLHALRGEMGDDAFFRFLRRLAYPTVESERARNPARFATTDDVIRTANAAAGRDLTWFFDVYLRQPALPRLVETRSGTALTLRWDVPAGLSFPMSVPVVVDGQARRVAMDGGTATVTLPRATSTVQIDPEGWVLRAM